MLKIIRSVLPLLALFLGCGGLEYSPNQVFSGDSPRNINRNSINRLNEEQGDARIRFILTGDSQRAYKHSKDLVDAINKLPEIDFVVLDGDISDFGLYQEMESIDQIFSKLSRPYIAVIGNHDLVANGERVYKHMFGELNFSFVYQGVKFVCHNTNSRESSFEGNVPDLAWLKQQLLPETGVDAYISIAHVPPDDADFDESLATEYVSTINNSPNTLAALFAHTHNHRVFYPGFQKTIPYIITDPIEKRKFVLIEILDGKLKFENITY